jgi:hypothetical protein
MHSCKKLELIYTKKANVLNLVPLSPKQTRTLVVHGKDPRIGRRVLDITLAVRRRNLDLQLPAL